MVNQNLSFASPGTLHFPAAGCRAALTVDTKPFVCLPSHRKATSFISANLEHQTGTFSYCVQPVPSLLLTGMTNG